MSFLLEDEEKCTCGNEIEWPDIGMCESCMDFTNRTRPKGQEKSGALDLFGNELKGAGTKVLKKKVHKQSKKEKEMELVEKHMNLALIETLEDLMKFDPGPKGTLVPFSNIFWKLWKLHKEQIKEQFYMNKVDKRFYLFRKTKSKKKKGKKTKSDSITAFF
jgi:hypothetical protein